MVGGALHFTDRADGDFHIDGDPAALDARRRRMLDGPWTWLRQVHGAQVVVVDEPGQHAGAEADAVVTAHPDAVLAVHTADCVPVLLVGMDADVVGAAHVGWRGLVAGVLDATADAMAGLGARQVHAYVGPHIRARCYEFGASELDQVASVCGDRVRATTAWGTPALDLLAGIQDTLARRGRGVLSVSPHAGCTACEPDRYFSHRARGDTGRHAAIIRRGSR